MERVKHLISGGWWEENGKYVQAGEGVQEILDSKDFQRRLGWATDQLSIPGMWSHSINPTLLISSKEQFTLIKQ